MDPVTYDVPKKRYLEGMNIHKSQPFMRVSRWGFYGFRLDPGTQITMGFQVPIIDNFVCQTCGFILAPKTWILTAQLWISTIQNVDSDHSLGLIHRGLGIDRHETLIFCSDAWKSCDMMMLPVLWHWWFAISFSSYPVFRMGQPWGLYKSWDLPMAHTLPGKVSWSKTMMMKC